MLVLSCLLLPVEGSTTGLGAAGATLGGRMDDEERDVVNRRLFLQGQDCRQ